MEVVSKRLLLILAAIALLGLMADPAVAQCSMCRTALAGSNNSLFIRNFNIGVLVLLVPPVAIFCTMFVALKRHKRRDEVADQGSEDKG